MSQALVSLHTCGGVGIALVGALVVGLALGCAAAWGDPEAKGQGGVIVNQAADAIVGYLRPERPLGKGATREMLVKAVEELADQYEGTRVSHIFWNVCYQRAAYRSDAWPSYWDVDDPAKNASHWPRCYWQLHEQGIDDIFAILIPRTRERGISPWVSLRMNDMHYSYDPRRFSPLWHARPDLRVSEKDCFNYMKPEVRQNYMKLIEEVLGRWDIDGVELDWMRFARHFKPEEMERGCAVLTEFMREVRKRADAAAKRLGHPVGIAARVPARPEFARGLGMDGVTWAREGLVDILIPSSHWRPSYADIPVEQWRKEIGPEGKACRIAPCTDLWIRCTPPGRFMRSDMETIRGFTASMLDRGADQIYLFNHFARVDSPEWYRTAAGKRKHDHVCGDLLNEAGKDKPGTTEPRRHVLTYHDPVPAGSDYRRPMPADIAAERTASFRVHTGPMPTSGRYVIRLGLDDSPDLADAQLGVKLNGEPCRAVDDLPKAIKPEPNEKEPRGYLGAVAPRVAQFEAPGTSVRRGYNAIEVSVAHGGPQRVIWLEVYIEPGPGSTRE